MELHSSAASPLIARERGERREFLGGAIECGPNPLNIVITLISIVLFWILYLKYAFHYFPKIYVHVTISFLLQCILFILIAAVVLIDPGILPKDQDIGEYMESSAPVKVVLVNSKPVVTVWCPTCRIYKPPRSKHCKYCNLCIKRFDHHCPWLSNCVGYNNYKFFIVLIFFSCLDGIFHFYSLIKIFQFVKNAHRFSGDILNYFLFFLLIILNVCQIFVFGFYFFYLLYLISKNKTTNEDLTKALDMSNPYDKGLLGNWMEFFDLPFIPNLRRQ